MRVLLTRPQAQSEELGAVLEGQGVEWLGEPLLRIVPVPWDPGVIAGKQALLLTSANASRELLRVSGDRRDMPIHAVRSGIADACSRMTAIAISRKVTEALRLAGFGRVVAAELPGIGSVVDAVLRVASEGVRDPQGGSFRRYAPMLPRCRAAPRTLTLGCCDRQGAAGILSGRPPDRPGSSPG